MKLMLSGQDSVSSELWLRSCGLWEITAGASAIIGSSVRKCDTAIRREKADGAAFKTTVVRCLGNRFQRKPEPRCDERCFVEEEAEL